MFGWLRPEPQITAAGDHDARGRVDAVQTDLDERAPIAGCERQTAVGAAEAERIRQRQPHVALAWSVAHQVDVAIGIEFAQIGVDGQRAVVDCQCAHGGFDCAGGGDQMSHHALGRADCHVAPVFSEHRLHSSAFAAVVHSGRRAVRV
jgi:hypothetical protein